MGREKRIIAWDTRQKEDKHEHILNWFEENDFKVVRTKLFCGDVCYLNDMSFCIDTKKDIQEIVGNVTSQHKRFVEEIQRANDNGIKLVFLIQDDYITKLEELNRWSNPRRFVSPKATSGKTLFKILYGIEKKYDTKFYFTTRENCGATIMKLLEEHNV